jgi:hypothetical protein
MDGLLADKDLREQHGRPVFPDRRAVIDLPLLVSRACALGLRRLQHHYPLQQQQQPPRPGRFLILEEVDPN